MASKRESILENLKTTIAGITVANGYNTDVQMVTRTIRDPLLSKVDFTQNPQAFVVDGSESLVEATNKHIESRVSQGIGGLPVKIHVFMNSTDSTTINALIEDVKKAIYADATRGGYAIHTTLPTVDIVYDRDYPHNDVIFLCRVVYDYPADTP